MSATGSGNHFETTNECGLNMMSAPAGSTARLGVSCSSVVSAPGGTSHRTADPAGRRNGGGRRRWMRIRYDASTSWRPHWSRARSVPDRNMPIVRVSPLFHSSALNSWPSGPIRQVLLTRVVDRLAAEVVPLPEHRVLATHLHDFAGECQQFLLGLQPPVDQGSRCPGGRRCCCPLRPAQLVAHGDHGHPLDSTRVADRLRIWRCRSRLISTSGLPSTPRFNCGCRYCRRRCLRHWPRCVCGRTSPGRAW